MPLPDDLLQPIPGANPAGANLRYDPVYAQIKEAGREEEDLDQGEWKRPRKVADWSLVAKLASGVLAKQSKDLWVAAWLTEALVRQEGLAGLRVGLALLRGLLERFWDGVYPQLDDGDAGQRAAPLAWVGGYVDVAVRMVPVAKGGHDIFRYKESRSVPTEAEARKDEKKLEERKAALAGGTPSPEEFEKAFLATPKAWYKQLRGDLQESLGATQALDELGQQKFGDAAPSYTKLRGALEEVSHVVEQLLDKKLQVEPDPTDAAAPRDAASGGTLNPAAGTALAPEPTSVDDAASRIAGAARFLRHADPRNPAPYLMLRGFRWGELRAHGPELDPKLLAAPPTQLRTHLKGLLLDGKWAELLDAGENVMATPHGRGWLDLQRYELTACEALGPEYEWVTAAIERALIGLLRDLPQLADLTLMDDTPTANAETRAWLESGGLLTAAAQAAEEARGARRGPARTEARLHFGHAAFDRAMDEVRAGRPQKGIELLMREAEQEKSPRARFLRRAEAAGIMVDVGLEPVALPILNELVQQIEDHKLEEWELAEVVARPMGLLYRALEKLGGDAVLKDTLYQRICRLDPMQAIAFPAGSAGSDGSAGT
jgi:type VI secretion system protein ImpA